mmetsp:Transcript_51016/g.163257  ORF Transcript_51016/g.163257 Transcript_51016/m.163257 type:complete len:254 (-) Transcript_51016:102-863(-)
MRRLPDLAALLHRGCCDFGALVRLLLRVRLLLLVRARVLLLDIDLLCLRRLRIEQLLGAQPLALPEICEIGWGGAAHTLHGQPERVELGLLSLLAQALALPQDELLEALLLHDALHGRDLPLPRRARAQVRLREHHHDPIQRPGAEGRHKRRERRPQLHPVAAHALEDQELHPCRVRRGYPDSIPTSCLLVSEAQERIAVARAIQHAAYRGIPERRVPRHGLPTAIAYGGTVPLAGGHDLGHERRLAGLGRPT